MLAGWKQVRSTAVLLSVVHVVSLKQRSCRKRTGVCLLEKSSLLSHDSASTLKMLHLQPKQRRIGGVSVFLPQSGRKSACETANRSTVSRKAEQPLSDGAAQALWDYLEHVMDVFTAPPLVST